MRCFPKTYRPLPYPQDWCRRVSFINLLGVESWCGTERLEVQYLRAVMTVSGGFRPPAKSETLRLGVVRKVPNTRDQIEYRTTYNPLSLRREEQVYSVREILEEIEARYKLEYSGRFPDVVIKERVIREPIPSGVNLSEAPPVLQSSNEFISYQREVCPQYHKKVFQSIYPTIDWSKVMNPYEFVKNGLRIRGIISPGDLTPEDIRLLRKVKGVLRTDAVATDQTQDIERLGYDPRGTTPGERVRKDVWIFRIESRLTGKYWFWDLGSPIRHLPAIDGLSLSREKVAGTIYRLKKEQKYLFLPT